MQRLNNLVRSKRSIHWSRTLLSRVLPLCFLCYLLFKFLCCLLCDTVLYSLQLPRKSEVEGDATAEQFGHK
jgi:hypothetical protein